MLCIADIFRTGYPYLLDYGPFPQLSLQSIAYSDTQRRTIWALTIYTRVCLWWPWILYRQLDIPIYLPLKLKFKVKVWNSLILGIGGPIHHYIVLRGRCNIRYSGRRYDTETPEDSHHKGSARRDLDIPFVVDPNNLPKAAVFWTMNHNLGWRLALITSLICWFPVRKDWATKRHMAKWRDVSILRPQGVEDHLPQCQFYDKPKNLKAIFRQPKLWWFNCLSCNWIRFRE